MKYSTLTTNTTQFDERWQAVWDKFSSEDNKIPESPGFHNQYRDIKLFRWVKQRIKYKKDVGDTWQSPNETLKLGTGDCEDYAILWLALGLDHWPRSKLRLVIGTSPKGEHHAAAVMGGKVYDCLFRLNPIGVENLSLSMTPLWSLYMDGGKKVHIPRTKRT